MWAEWDLREEEEEDEASQIWKEGIYVGGVRNERKYTLQNLIKCLKIMFDTYVNDYKRKFEVAKAKNPKEKIVWEGGLSTSR